MVFRVYVFSSYTLCEKFSNGKGHAERAKISMWKKVITGCSYGGHHRQGFTMRIEEHHLKQSYMTTPAEFLERNDDLKKKRKTILVNSGGHAWEVKLAVNHDHWLPEYSQRNARNGLAAFLKSNNIQREDVCDFSLEHCSTPLFIHELELQ